VPGQALPAKRKRDQKRLRGGPLRGELKLTGDREKTRWKKARKIKGFFPKKTQNTKMGRRKDVSKTK